MDNYTMDELILAFALKFENNALEILQRLYEGTPVPVNEIDEILKKVEEKYVVITSDDYPDFFHRVDNPPFVFFYEGNLELFEDNIGLRAICTITDSEVIEKAKNNQLRGWSFGFYAEKDHWETSENGYEKRTVEELDLFEVTIVDNTRNPAYSATSIEMRDDKEILTENRVIDFKAIIVDESKNKEERTNIDYSKYENEIESFKKS